MANYDSSIRVRTEVDNKELREAEKEVERLTKKFDGLKEKGKKLEVLGGTEKQFKSLDYDTEQVYKRLQKAIDKANELKTSSVCDADQSQGFEKATGAARKFFSVLNKDSKKSNAALSNTSKMISKMMIRMLALKAITGTISYVKDGVDNLVQYSTDLNGVFSDLKSSSAQLKNSLATAFAPILTMAIPYITKLIGWLITAANAISQFWAVLGGKNTYTKAKKQVVDYAKSLGTATKAAKGALAAFDEINVLEKNDDSGSAGGGELTGADAFEEVAVDEGFAAAVEKVKAVLEAILPLVILIGAAFLAWKIYDFLSSLMLVHPVLGTIASWLTLIIGMVLAVYNYFKMWTEGVDWGGIIGYVAGVTAAVVALYMLFGPLVAGIALIIAAIAGVVLAIKDILENGVTAENMGLLIISIVGLLVGVFLAFGSTVAIVVGEVVAVIAVLAMLVSYGGNGAEALEHLRNTFKSLGEFVKKVFAGDFKGALEDLKEAGRSFGNFFISVAEGVANGFIKMVNAIIDAINSIDVTIPDWVPIFGGKQFSPSIPNWDAHVSFPRLATGGIATSSTIANIGEAGREAVLPLENHTEWMDTLAERINSGREIRIVFTGDLAELGRVLKPVIDAENSRIGASLLMG